MKPTRILIVEDEVIVALDIQDRLADLGYAVAGVADRGKEALELAAATRPDLVLMDIRLKGEMDGITAAEEIRQRWRIPVIFLTAFSEDSTLQRAKLSEPFGYLIKPFEDREIQAAIEMALYKHEAEGRLRESERRYATTLTSIGDGVIATDPMGGVTFMNPVAERLTGWPRDEAYGRPLAEIFRIANEQTGQAVEDPVTTVLRECRTVGLANHTILIRRDGGEVPIDDCAAPILDDFGKLAGTVLVFQDVTDRRAKAAALRESEERLRLALTAADQGMYDLNVQTGEAVVSPEYARMLGYDPELFRETTAAWHDRLHPEDREQGYQVYLDYIEGRRDEYRLELRQQTESGDWKWILSLGKIVEWDKDGKPLRMLGTLTDITQRKEIESDRLEMERRLLHAQKLESLGVLAGGIAHDFNNLLMAILGYADLALLEVSPVSPARPRIQEIINASHRAADLCRQMLAYSGKGKFVIEHLRLDEVIHEMIHMLKTCISKKALLNLNLAKDLPCIEGDPAQIRQVLMNLVINASEAIGERSGVVTISTGARHCDAEYLRETFLDDSLPEGLYVSLEVSDTGCGMDKETQARIFEPFFTTKFTGRGLGMSAVLGIVRGHRGALKVYSEPGKGTTFRLLFPASFQEGEALAVDAVESGEEWCGSGTVLLVDDEETILGIGRLMLERLGFSVITAVDGKEAVEIYRFRSKEIAMVLLDLTMPRMNGEDAFRELRRIDPGVRVILSSGYSEQEIAARFAGKGLAGFIQKPYQLERLRDALKGIDKQA
ncbi:MAG: response regulator [Syntrophobacteraceae bacterium]